MADRSDFDPEAFDASLSPVVEICELTEPEPEVFECIGGDPKVAYNMTSGIGSEVADWTSQGGQSGSLSFTWMIFA